MKKFNIKEGDVNKIDKYIKNRYLYFLKKCLFFKKFR